MNMKKTILPMLMVAAAPLCVSAQISPDHKVATDKGDISAFVGDYNQKGDRKEYKGDELYTIGMPVGGICAGQLYVRGDGTLANWWIANNAYNTGYGIDHLLNFDTPLGPWQVCYQTFEPKSYFDQGFSIKVASESDRWSKDLSKKDFDDISFIGEYPVAEVRYGEKNGTMPVSVSAEFYSPFVPLDARRSATPATIMKYTVRNNSASAVTVDLTGRQQNIVCADLKESGEGLLRNRSVAYEGFRSLVMDLTTEGVKPPKETKRQFEVFEDFESGSFRNWTVEGTAFGTRPAGGELNNQNPFGGDFGRYLANSYVDRDEPVGKLTSKPFTVKRRFISFNIAGGNHPGETCANLVVDGKVVRTATGNSNEDFLPRNWDVSEFKGKKAHIEIVDKLSGDWGHISVDNIQFSDVPITIPKSLIDSDHPYFGNFALSVFDPDAKVTADVNGERQSAEAPLGTSLVGSLTSSFSLAPGESKEVVYVLSWYFPNRPLDYRGTVWNRPIPPNRPAIGNMYTNWYDSSLDVADYVYKNYDELSGLTHSFRDAYYKNTTLPYWLTQRCLMSLSTLATETCQWWSNDKFWAWEGVGSCDGTCTHVWGYAQTLASFFPELERNLREKTDYSVSFQPDGGILARNGDGGILVDGHASVILRMYREHLMSKNDYFLARNWDKVKKSIEYLIREDGNEDGLIVKNQPNTYDISFNGANTYVGGLYLAALRAGEKMAYVMKDTVAAKRYNRIYTAGSANTMDRLWNGEYFYQDVDAKEYPYNQYGHGCLADQLFGQTWASLYRLGDLYPTDAVNTAMKSIWKYNWTNDVKAQSELHLPERYYAHSGEPGLFICTWPHETHPGERGVRYRDEVWTGIEYQVATEMIERGMIEEGLAIVKGAHSRYDGKKHNPWNEIECGDHYARAMASYGIMKAIQGYWYDGPKGIIGFAPKVEENDFTGFFTSAEGWGNMSQRRSADRQENSIELLYGKLRLTQIQLQIPASASLRGMTVKINGETLSVADRVVDGQSVYVDIPETTIHSGGRLEVVFDI